MAVLSDLLTLRKELLSASAGQEKAQKETAFQAQVADEILAFYDNPKYPQRRRSFSRIRERLGIFEADDPELKSILFSMGARVHRGNGEDAVWEMPLQVNTPPPAAPAKRPMLPRLGLGLIVLAVALVMANTVLSTVFGVTIPDFLKGMGRPEQTHEACLEAANGTFLEIVKCNSEHG